MGGPLKTHTISFKVLYSKQMSWSHCRLLNLLTSVSDSPALIQLSVNLLPMLQASASTRMMTSGCVTRSEVALYTNRKRMDKEQRAKGFGSGSAVALSVRSCDA